MTTRPVLVIGGTSEIGTSIGLRLALLDGRPVALTHAPRSHPAPSLEARCQPGYFVRWYAHDVRSSQGTEDLVQAVTREFDAPPDLVYCAGTSRSRPLAVMTDEDWWDVLSTNLTGAFFAARAVSRGLIKCDDGRIVFIGASAAVLGTPGQANYAAAKAGLEALACQVAAELGPHGATCNVVTPGLIEGRRTYATGVPMEQLVQRAALKRLGTPTEVAHVVAFLISDNGRYMTGQNIAVNGGLAT